MSENHPVASFCKDNIKICFPARKQELLNRIISSPEPRSFTDLKGEERELLFAIADLRNWQDQFLKEVEISNEHLWLSHNAAASLSASSAEAMGLPPTVELTLKTDVTGVLGRANSNH